MNEIERLYPDEWILLGNPEIDTINQKFLAGEVVYHSRDKKEVCYLGKPLVAKYNKTALFFNRVTPRNFFENTIICINLKANTITISK